MEASRRTTMSLSRRGLLRAGAGAAAGYALGGAALAGCGSGSGSGSGAGTVRVVVPEGGLLRAFTAAARDFEQTTSTRVEIVSYPYAEARQQQLLALAEGTGGVDAVLIDGEIWLAELHQFLDPVDDRISPAELDRFVPSMPPMFQRDGATYALPFRVGGWVLIYRTDLFEQAGIDTPPRTWAEFRQAAEALTNGDVYGFTAPLAQSNFLVVQWIPFLWSFGAEILTPDLRQAAFADDAGIAATQFLVDLYRDELMPPGAIEADNDGVITSMQQGRAAMAITYSPYFLEMNNPDQSEYAGRFSVAGQLPYQEGSGLTAGRSVITGWGVGIAQGSGRKEETWQLADYLTTDEVQLRLAVEHGNSPTLRTTYEQQEYLAAYPVAGEVLGVLESAATRPGIPTWSRVEEVLALRLSEAVTDSRPVPEALSQAADEVNQLLAS